MYIYIYIYTYIYIYIYILIYICHYDICTVRGSKHTHKASR